MLLLVPINYIHAKQTTYKQFNEMQKLNIGLQGYY